MYGKFHSCLACGDRNICTRPNLQGFCRLPNQHAKPLRNRPRDSPPPAKMSVVDYISYRKRKYFSCFQQGTGARIGLNPEVAFTMRSFCENQKKIHLFFCKISGNCENPLSLRMLINSTLSIERLISPTLGGTMDNACTIAALDVLLPQH